MIINSNLRSNSLMDALFNAHLSNDFDCFIRMEKVLFKDNKDVDYKLYQKELIQFLVDNNINNDWITYVKNIKPNIAVYPGSFNPMHQGHLSILEKAEKIFDKVIIARGQNLDKSSATYDFPNIVKKRQIETYNGLLTDFLDSLGYDVTVIRGLRNATDLQYETTQLRFMQDLKPNIKMVSIFCDQELEHISSSAIRMLEKYGKAEKYKL